MHGNLAHTGKIPVSSGEEGDKKSKILKQLRTRLQKLVEKEDFEEAARVRDEIRKLET